jgi:uncharacterized membrane protein
MMSDTNGRSESGSMRPAGSAGRGRTDEQGVESTAAIARHPIHPMLVPFPIGFLLAALGSDVGYWITQDAFWARASLWLVGAGLLTGLGSAAAGLVDFVTISRVRELRAAWIHFIGNATAIALAAVSWILRLPDPSDAVLPGGLVLSAAIAAILGLTGWYGGELSYRYRVGVIRDR